MLKIAPKSTLGSFRMILIAAYVAASAFNDRANAYLQIINVLETSIERNTYEYCQDEDANCLKNVKIKTLKKTKKNCS